jgi:protein-S-isoprenylcysteine O-methyltransferase Ste14
MGSPSLIGGGVNGEETVHLLDQKTLGIGILLLLAGLVIIKRMATGSILKDRPKSNLRIWLTQIFNLFFLLFVNPLAAVLLITGYLEAVDPTRLTISMPWLLMGVEIGGMGLYVMGFILMGWALIRLGRNYQAGGSDPRVADGMVMGGPYKLVRHPMYSAALVISLGLACVVQSLAFFSVFCIYFMLIILLIPAEEGGLRRAYGEQYIAYQQRVKRLFPFFF